MQLIRETSEYKMELTDPYQILSGKGSQPILVPSMMKITRKINVTNTRTGKVYPKGSHFYLSLDVHPRVPVNSDLMQWSGHNFSYATTNQYVQKAVSPPKTYYSTQPNWWIGNYTQNFTIQYGGNVSEETLKANANMKLVICGGGMYAGTSRETARGATYKGIALGTPSGEQNNLFSQSHWNWVWYSVRGTWMTAIDIKFVDYQRWSYARLYSRAHSWDSGGGGAQCSAYCWTTQYFDPEDLVYTLRIK